MRKDKEIAINLRKEGKSYNEIRSLLGMSKATLSEWFSQKEWSAEIRENLSKKLIQTNAESLKNLNRIRGERLNKLYIEAKDDAETEFQTLKTNPLFLAGMFLYWGEGDKANKYQVRISNSEPAIVKIFLSFLENICGVPKDRIWLSVIGYLDMNINETECFWSEKVSLDRDNFQKTMIIPSRSKVKKLAYGTAVAGVSSRFLKEKVLVWLALLEKEFLALVEK